MGKRGRRTEEPSFRLSLQNNRMLNYDVYRFHPVEKAGYFLLAFAVGGVLGLIFYGNLFLEEGSPTRLTSISNIVVFVGMGMGAAALFLPFRQRSLTEKRRDTLRLQFREMLSSLSTNYAAGCNTAGAFAAAQADMTAQFGEKSLIAAELREMVTGMENNFRIDDLLMDFGKRSGLEDVEDFASAFLICYEKGGDLKRIVRYSYDMIGEKLAVHEEIRTKILSNQMQLNFMSVVPPVLIAFLRLSSSSFAEAFATKRGVMSMTAALGIFVGSYLYGRKITEIRG